MKIWKAFGRKRSWPDRSTMTLKRTSFRRIKYPGVCLEELRKTMENLSQDSRFAGRDSNRTLSRQVDHLIPSLAAIARGWRSWDWVR
jgi:hypothetical protein